jgi:hypothetical protein
MGIKINEIGNTYGRLIVTSEAGRDKQGRATWNCLCDCGQPVTVSGYNLRDGHTQSCGCLQRELAAAQEKTTHGHNYSAAHGGPSPTYHSWSAMKARCINPNTIGWKNYGGRGIKVCKRWSVPRGFQRFLADMGPRPRGRSLDRKNNDKGYSPSNCRWATRRQQRLNQRPRRAA